MSKHSSVFQSEYHTLIEMGQMSPEFINNINFEERSSRNSHQTIKTTSSPYYCPCLIHSNITAQSFYHGFSYSRNVGYSKTHFSALKSFCSRLMYFFFLERASKQTKSCKLTAFLSTGAHTWHSILEKLQALLVFKL